MTVLPANPSGTLLVDLIQYLEVERTKVTVLSVLDAVLRSTLKLTLYKKEYYLLISTDLYVLKLSPNVITKNPLFISSRRVGVMVKDEKDRFY